MARNEEEGEHTPAVVNGHVMRTSVSALTAFDPESYGGCPRRYFFTRVLGVKEEKTVAQDIGTQGHEQIEHYLPAGKGVLGPYAMAGKHLLPRPGSDLVIEGRFGDIKKAVELRKEMLASKDTDEIITIREVMEIAAGLTAGNIPLDGYIDVRHGRGEFVDASGLVQRERPEHGNVVEVIDHKFTSSIESFAKGPTELASTIQMQGYANYVLNVVPDVDHVRLSHIYYQTRGQKLAKKVTALLSARAARDGWERVNDLADYMEEVVRAKRVEDVEPQKKSCDAYRGCPHLARCPITRKFGSGGNMSLFGNQGQNQNTNGAGSQAAQPAGSSTGSLFGSLLGKSAETPKTGETAKPPEAAKTSLFGGSGGTQPSTDDAAHRAAVDAEMQKLAAEDKGQPVQSMGAEIPVTACVLDKSYFVDAEDGAKPRLSKFAGSSKGFYFFVDAAGGRVKLEVADNVFEVVMAKTEGAGSAVSPPDAPKSSMPGAAAPLSQEQIDKIEDPEVKKRAQEHAQQVQQAAQQQAQQSNAAASEKTSGRCPESEKKIVFSADQLAMQEYTCKCGKVYTFKKLNAAKEGVEWRGTLPGHNIKNVVTTPTPTTTTPAATTTTPAASQSAFPPAMVRDVVEEAKKPVAPSSLLGGIMLFVDIAVERGASLMPLDTYYEPLVRKLEEDHGAADIRCAPADSALSFGKWKGALAAVVRSTPPEPGIYAASSTSEVAQVVIEALAPRCTAVLRGMR